MREKLKITEAIFPMPVMMIATYNDDGSVNVMNAAWCTMQERDTVALNLTETHKTVQNIKARGAFTVSIADAAHVVEADYLGDVSGNKVPDKFARTGLTASKAETVDAPVINEFPLVQAGADIVADVCISACGLVHDIIPHDVHVLLVCQDKNTRHVCLLHIKIAQVERGVFKQLEAAFMGFIRVGDHDGQQMVWRGGIDDGLEGWLRGIKRWWLDAWKGNPLMRTEWRCRRNIRDVNMMGV